MALDARRDPRASASAGRPIDPLPALDHLAAVVEEALRSCGARWKSAGTVRDDARPWSFNVASSTPGAGRGGDPRRRNARPSGPTSVRPANPPCWACSPGRCRIRRRDLRPQFRPHGVGLDLGLRSRRRLREISSAAVDLEGGRTCWSGSSLYMQRLGEGRLVALVVAEAAIAEHVDHDRLVELSAGIRWRPWQANTTASGSSPLTWKIGASTILARSEG